MARSGLLDKLSFSSESESDSEFPDTIPDFPPESEPGSETDDVLEPDPKPRRGGGKPRTTAPKVTAAIKKEARETLSALVELPIAIWERRDPVCAGVADEQADRITDALLAIFVKRPQWLAVLTDAGESADWIRLAKAVYPVVMIVWAHHVAHTVGQDDEGEGDDLATYSAPRLS